MSFVVVAEDHNHRYLPTGVDAIRVESQQTSAGPGPSPGLDVVDNSNGTRTITITTEQDGEHSFEVFINNEKLQQRLSISCHSMTFDPAECQAENTSSETRSQLRILPEASVHQCWAAAGCKLVNTCGR